MERHTRYHMQVIPCITISRTTFRTFGDILEDIRIPVVLIALSLHIQPVAGYALAVQRSRTGYGADPCTLTAYIYHLLIYIDIVGGYGGETAFPERGTHPSRGIGEVQHKYTCLIFIVYHIAMVASIVARIRRSDLFVRIERIEVRAQERIVACTFVLQTAVVQFDVIVCCDKDAPAVVRRISHILYIDVITFFGTATEAYLREVAKVFRLCKKQQVALQPPYVRFSAKVDIAEACAEECASIVVLEIHFRSGIHDDITALARIDRQVAVIALVV